MADKPILFSGPMVRAILEGRKTMTRRIMKPQPVDGTWKHPRIKMGYFKCESGDRPSVFGAYVPGDTLWVRETWSYATGPNRDEPDDPEHHKIIYREQWVRENPDINLDGCWKPSIFMPRFAARISLRVTDVRVERLQDITEEDAIAEGVEPHLDGWYPYGRAIAFWKGAQADVPAQCCITARDSFEGLWDSLNAKRGFPWASNPWVWVVSFERVQP